MDFGRELEVARNLARRAGALAVRYQGGNLDVEMKPGDEPVTAADRAASDLIVSGLSEAFVDDVLISEENADDERRLTAHRVWYVDPIDGTKDFIRGEDGFSIMIGLAIDGEPAVGVVYQPVGERMYSAAPGGGTWVALGDAPARRVSCSEVSAVADIRLVASKSHRSGTMDKVKTTLGIDDELNVGSVGLKIGIIARGDRDLYVNPSSKCKAWDTCAPAALLQEAGGTLSDIHGDPLDYRDPDIAHRRGLLASNGRVHAAVVAKLAELFPRHP